MLWLITIFEYTHSIRSNRESGNGRYYIQLAAKKEMLPGIIIEIKTATTEAEKQDLPKLAQTALAQIEEKKYDTKLLA